MSSGPGVVSFAQPPARLVAALGRRNAIGIVAAGYGTEKVSYGLAPAGYTFHKLLRAPLHRLERRGTFWHHTPLLLDYPVELVHAFNELPLGARPFIVSFENELPRYLESPPAWQLDLGYSLIASARCRQVLALSEAAAAALRARLVARGMDDVTEKVGVFRGSVLAPPSAGADAAKRARSPSAPLRVLFVGRDALRKGLPPTLDALDACRANGVHIEATIVCDFDAHSYIGTWTAADTQRTVARLRSMPGVTYIERLPNAGIHRLMQSHDVLIFPTLDESLGWVAIEAAMAGMTVITTDIFALPELVVDGTTGVLIPLEKNETRRWVGLWMRGAAFDDEMNRTSQTIRDAITRALLRFVADRTLVDVMGEAARAHIESLYGFAAARSELAGIYAGALGR